MCSNVVTKKMPTQWQEIHMLLVALHETLLQKALLTFSDSHEFETDADSCDEFWTRVRLIKMKCLTTFF